ncbi:unnamed protein product [Microthlaspi erraticum]|uniref:Uncharacterized protein n=1 Tax=Microthlaspi erraticum TaxID=1685480 RepID=A0A6D2HYI6_9BRAS|nr:unnamed protein product [Microthlaspi erraticum]CAA7053088.1 unnamed protein product [Microthlaspi erraticum]
MAGSSLHPTLGHRLTPNPSDPNLTSPSSRISVSKRIEVPVEQVTITLPSSAKPTQVLGKRKAGRPRIASSPIQGASLKKRNLTRAKATSKKCLNMDPIPPARPSSSLNPTPTQGGTVAPKKKASQGRKQKNKVDFHNPPNSLP